METSFPEIEEEILKFWRENTIFKKSIAARKKAPNFVFFEGPPTANGRPGIHHILARVFKDLIPRYKTMKGFRVIRKAGWDTHGLPVELEIEKKMGFKIKKDIENFGIARFNNLCKKSVWEYKEDWQKLTERIAFWVDMENAYITYEPDYMETLFWIIKQAWQKGLLEKDYKVVPYCPRCGTPLSSHEVAQGYKTVKEPAAYIKFKARGPEFKNQNAYFLAWTTTPWTLPGNVALAVNPQAIYVRAQRNNEILILAKEKVSVLGKDLKLKEEFKGKDLIGLRYEPLFPYLQNLKVENIENAFQILPADFVSLEEGTGIVHTAVMYGEEDFDLGKKFKLPFHHLVDEGGKFKEEVKKWPNVFVKEADPLIIRDLRERKLLFKEELYEHEYPFCWRCKAPLLYYAKQSWFIRMRRLKKDLIANNQKINWVPSYLKGGRFGEWLRDVKDWALSRERYWGTPLPVWRCRKCNRIEVIGSKKDLLFQKFSQNRYFLLRHGQTVYGEEKKGMVYPLRDNPSVCLSKKGEKQIRETAEKLRKEKIDLIFSSDYYRTKQTAQIVSQELKLKINFDRRLRDVGLGIYHSGSKENFYRQFKTNFDRFYKKSEGGESGKEVLKRILSFIKEIEKKYENKTILIVSHGDPLWWLDKSARGELNEKLLKREDKPDFIAKGELRKLELRFLPYNERMEPDFHRPYIDKVKFYCPKCQGAMEREEGVIDCWFDSGAMPFAQYHYPFENKNLIDRRIQFPADYICEAIDQTRGWFYTLLAISTFLEYKSPFRNVISLGHVLDEKGEKMSKSRGNVVDPWLIVNKYGADATRWYFYTINQPYESKCFSEKDVSGVLRRFTLILWNCYLFFETYSEVLNLKSQNPKSKNILDRWILDKLERLKKQISNCLDNYDITTAARSIEKFVIEDLSQWYIRRSRKRFQKPEKKKEKTEASITLAWILFNLVKLTAPFMPFLSEKIYQNLKFKSRGLKFKESVHLEGWPKSEKKCINSNLERNMNSVRQIVTLGLRARARAGIKVRQPLKSLKINVKLKGEFLNLIKDELNVKEVRFVEDIKKTRGLFIERENKLRIALDTEITPGLKEEGILREIIRNIQEMRGRANLKPSNKIIVFYQGNTTLIGICLKNKKAMLNETIAENLERKEGRGFEVEKEIKIDGEILNLAIKRLR